MAGTILENLSGKKLSILVGTLLVCQVICFLIGGLIGKLKLSWKLLYQSLIKHNNFIRSTAPKPVSVQSILGTICEDIPGSFNDTSKWIYSRGVGKCESLLPSDLNRHDVRMANKIVFVFQVEFVRLMNINRIVFSLK